jgi:hypothetical protein
MTTSKNRPRVPVQYPSGVPIALMGISLLIIQAACSVGVPPLALPFVILLPWAPYLYVEGKRRKQASKSEKQAMQDRFDAEDIALFGSKLG